jgi:drug/metabolite transporter (DMT)-like permease
MPFAENTVILFSESLFMLPLTAIFLSERTSAKSVCATLIGFLGLIIMYRPNATNINLTAIVPTLAAILFSVMNVMMKKMVDNKENDLTMLFYFALYATVLSGAIVPFFWTTPNFREFVLLFFLGIGANVIQLFVFLAYRATSASNVSQVRYIELPFAILFGFLFFGEIPDSAAFFGAFLIIIGTIIASYFNKSLPSQKPRIAYNTSLKKFLPYFKIFFVPKKFK